jgi:hypothetical protein
MYLRNPSLCLTNFLLCFRPIILSFFLIFPPNVSCALSFSLSFPIFPPNVSPLYTSLFLLPFSSYDFLRPIILYFLFPFSFSVSALSFPLSFLFFLLKFLRHIIDGSVGTGVLLCMCENGGSMFYVNPTMLKMEVQAELDTLQL